MSVKRLCAVRIRGRVTTDKYWHMDALTKGAALISPSADARKLEDEIEVLLEADEIEYGEIWTHPDRSEFYFRAWGL